MVEIFKQGVDGIPLPLISPVPGYGLQHLFLVGLHHLHCSKDPDADTMSPNSSSRSIPIERGRIPIQKRIFQSHWTLKGDSAKGLSRNFVENLW